MGKKIAIGCVGTKETIFLFRQPIGVIAGVLPWSFPFFLIAQKAAPALVTGNTIVINCERNSAWQTR